MQLHVFLRHPDNLACMYVIVSWGKAFADQTLITLCATKTWQIIVDYNSGNS